MKKVIKKVFGMIFGFIGFIYLVFAIFSIVCLFQKNNFGYPQFGNKTIVIIENDGDFFKEGDLVVLTKPDNKDVNINDAVFFYDTEYQKNTLNIGSIISKDVVNENETTFHVANFSFSSEFLIGKVSDSIKYPVIGSIIGVLTSKWGFFFLIIIPFFILFMIEIFAIYAEIKYGDKKKKNV